MALEYRLQVKTEISLFNLVESYLNEKKISFSREEIDKGVNIYLFEVMGFMTSIVLSRNVFFDYMVSENQVIEDEWDYSSDITFRLDKLYDNLLARLNMIDVCCCILKNTTEDARLLFNGDILVLERTNGEVIVNNNFGFWNSEDLRTKIKGCI